MPSETTQLLTSICAGDRSGIDRLMKIVYNDFRDLAHKYAAKLPSSKTLQPTEVVHEAFLKLVDQQDVDWRGKSHFFAVGARAMRHILVDYAKRKSRQKRGGGHRRIPLDEALTVSIGDDEDVLAIDEALERLASINEMRAKIVELRFFAGMTVEEVAEALGASKRNVEGHWTYAKAWLRRELAEGEENDARV
jgi:RNA polymerase sigma factor (TIGR02999 family)